MSIFDHFKSQNSKNICAILELQRKIMTSLDTLTAGVAGNTSVIQSAVTLLGNLKTSLDAAIAANQAGDASQLDALSAQLGQSDAALAAAITANTPAAQAQTQAAPTA